MPNMKALSMLDHVMLWIARGFAAISLTFVLFLVKRQIQDDIRFSHLVALTHRIRFQDPITSYYTPSVILLVIMLWNVSLWILRSNIGRLYLVLSAAVMFSVFTWTMSQTLLDHPRLPNFGFYGLLLGIIATVWTALRSPGQPRLRDMVLFSRRRFVQT